MSTYTLDNLEALISEVHDALEITHDGICCDFVAEDSGYDEYDDRGVPMVDVSDTQVDFRVPWDRAHLEILDFGIAYAESLAEHQRGLADNAREYGDDPTEYLARARHYMKIRDAFRARQK